MPDSPRPRLALALAATLAVTAALFSPLLNAWFMGEDWLWLERAQRDWTTLGRAFSVTAFNWFTPVVNALWSFEYRAFGFDATGYYALQIAAHLLVVVLFWAVLRVWGASPGLAAAGAAAFAFLDQPAQAVLFLAGNSHLFAAVFILLAALGAGGWARGKPAGLALAAVAFALALLTKEVAAIFAIVLPLAGALLGWPRARWGALLATLFAVLLVYVPIKMTVAPPTAYVAAGTMTFNPLVLLARAFTYVWITANPAALFGTNGIFYPYLPPLWLLRAVTGLGWTIALGGSLLLARGGEPWLRRLALAGWAWLYLVGVPYSVFGVAGDASRSHYLGGLGWAMILAAGAAALWQAASPRVGRPLLATLVAMYLLGQGAILATDILSWTEVGRLRRHVHEALLQAVPDPEPGARLVIDGLHPALYDGLWYARLRYGRDVTVEKAGDEGAGDGPAVELIWDEGTGAFRRR